MSGCATFTHLSSCAAWRSFQTGFYGVGNVHFIYALSDPEKTLRYRQEVTATHYADIKPKYISKQIGGSGHAIERSKSFFDHARSVKLLYLFVNRLSGEDRIRVLLDGLN